mmetsp:Transcript_70589/g.121153  ORF Transcript_70589/g.121153 Transcript_70589/m.121153 type:complete len:241 (+) Transcript_70589:2-724(+)
MLVAELDDSSERSESDTLVRVRSSVVNRARRMAGFVDIDFRPRKEAKPGDPPCPYVSDLAVCSTQRRRGIGKALLTAAEALVEQEGWRLLSVELERAGSGKVFDSTMDEEHWLRLACEKALFPPPECQLDLPSPSFVLQFPLKLYLKAERSNAGAMSLYHSLGYSVEQGYLAEGDGSNVLLAKTIAKDAAQLTRRIRRTESTTAGASCSKNAAISGVGGDLSAVVAVSAPLGRVLVGSDL